MEVWKQIPFETGYEVSDKGRVRNLKTKKIRKTSLDKNGYEKITLYPSWVTYTVHRLVGFTFLADSYQEGLQIDHLDANRTNNTVENLEWVTPQENQNRIKYRPPKVGTNNQSAIINDMIAYEIKYSFSESISEIVERLSVSRNIVEAVRRREAWTHVRDEYLEQQFELGKVTYKKGKSANLTKKQAEQLDNDLVNGATIKECVQKYSVSKSAVYSRKRNLRL